MLGSVLRPIRSAGYWIEGVVTGAITRFTRPFKGASRTSGIEAAVERMAGSVAERTAGPSRVGGAFEAGAGIVLRAITRCRLNYFFAAFFAGALGYELYLISIAATPSARDNLMSVLRLTIYFAIIFFSLDHFARSALQPWLAVWRAWRGVVLRIRTLPGAFATALGVYLIARAIGYLPASVFAGRESLSALGSFVLGFVLYFALCLVTARIYWKVVKSEPAAGPGFSRRRLFLTAAAMWVLTAMLKAALAPWTGFAPPRYAVVIFQFVWLAVMLWSALTLFVVPAVIAGVAKPVRTALAAGWRFWWTLVISLILVNFPADIYQVALSYASPRFSVGLPSRLAIDVVSAIVSAVVYFASQAAVLQLFVSAIRLKADVQEPRP